MCSLINHILDFHNDSFRVILRGRREKDNMVAKYHNLPQSKYLKKLSKNPFLFLLKGKKGK